MSKKIVTNNFQRATAIFLIAVFGTFLPTKIHSQENQASRAEVERNLEIKLTEEKQNAQFTQDLSGKNSSVWLPPKLANDESLKKLSRVSAITNLTIQGYSLRPSLTKEGISRLQELTNLVELHFGCWPIFPPGVFEKVCKLKNLRSLTLYFADPSKQDYQYLPKLQNLERLRIVYSTNFDALSFGALTNLTKLKSLELVRVGISKEDTNILSSMPHLTNLDIRFK